MLSICFNGLSKTESSNAFRCECRYKFYALENSIDNFMFNAAILSFGILAYNDNINILIRGFDTKNASTWPQISIKLK